MGLIVVSEAAARRLVSMQDAIAAMRQVLVAVSDGRMIGFPVLRGHGSDPATRFGVKAGFDGIRGVPGLKVGTYWPGNPARGLAAHGSTTLFLDDATGFPTGIVAASYLTSLRTAAVDAVAVSLLARKDASVLALFGSGNQAFYEALAIGEVRAIGQVLVVARDAGRAEALVCRLRDAGMVARTASAVEALGEADIVATVTAARAPLFEAADVRPGLHVSAMGADGPGKQELPVELVVRADLFADVPAQALEMGEFQHAAAQGLPEARVTALGDVVAGRTPGRIDDAQVTVFDSSGIAAQDLAICALALDRARESGDAQEVEFL